ncbi:MAG: recombinase family protein [Pseudomonadota bacterium]
MEIEIYGPFQPSVKLVGYARVSTEDQSVQMQVDALVTHGVPRGAIYTETVSGVSKKREVLDVCMKRCREGDTLVVWKLDRIGRSMLDLLKRMQELDESGVKFRSLTEGIDTSTPAGRLIFHVIGALAQFERDLIVERTREGVKARIARGLPHGGQTKMTPKMRARVLALMREGKGVTEIARATKLSPGTIYNHFPGGPAKWRDVTETDED